MPLFRHWVDLGILSCKFLLRQHDNGNLIVATMTTITTMKNPYKIKLKKGGIWCSNFTNVFKAQIRGISSIIILKWIIVIWIFQIMWLISLNLAFKIANLAIFFIVMTITTIVATIIVSKILLSSRQCCDKPKYVPIL